MNDQFENTAAWLEHCDGMSRFEAETEAARRQGKKRWEVIGNVAQRVVSETRNKREALAKRGSPDDLPAMQPHQTQEG